MRRGDGESLTLPGIEIAPGTANVSASSLVFSLANCTPGPTLLLPASTRWIVKRRHEKGLVYWRGRDPCTWHDGVLDGPMAGPAGAWSAYQRDAARYLQHDLAREAWREGWLDEHVLETSVMPPKVVFTRLVRRPSALLSLGTPMADLLKVSSLTGTELADRSGVSRQTITGAKGDVGRGGGIGLDTLVQRIRAAGWDVEGIRIRKRAP